MSPVRSKTEERRQACSSLHGTADVREASSGQEASNGRCRRIPGLPIQARQRMHIHTHICTYTFRCVYISLVHIVPLLLEIRPCQPSFPIPPESRLAANPDPTAIGRASCHACISIRHVTYLDAFGNHIADRGGHSGAPPTTLSLPPPTERKDGHSASSPGSAGPGARSWNEPSPCYMGVAEVRLRTCTDVPPYIYGLAHAQGPATGSSPPIASKGLWFDPHRTRLCPP